MIHPQGLWDVNKCPLTALLDTHYCLPVEVWQLEINLMKGEEKIYRCLVCPNNDQYLSLWINYRMRTTCERRGEKEMLKGRTQQSSFLMSFFVVLIVVLYSIFVKKILFQQKLNTIWVYKYHFVNICYFKCIIWC